MLHAIPSIDNRMRYSFDTIDIKQICDKIKTLDRDFKMDLHFVNHSSNECSKKKLLTLIKNSIACSCVSHKLLMYPIEGNCCER